jgi:hypothetical protein
MKRFEQMRNPSNIDSFYHLSGHGVSQCTCRGLAWTHRCGCSHRLHGKECRRASGNSGCGRSHCHRDTVQDDYETALGSRDWTGKISNTYASLVSHHGHRLGCFHCCVALKCSEGSGRQSPLTPDGGIFVSGSVCPLFLCAARPGTP